MKIHIGQFYLEVGAAYSLSYRFQGFLGEELSSRVEPSEKFIAEYGEDYELMFRISAKSGLTAPDVKGPTVFKDDKDVEYSIFLPFDKDRPLGELQYREVLALLFHEIEVVLKSLGMEVKGLAQDARDIIDQIVKNPVMFRR